LGILIAGIAAAPHRIAAQQAAPAAPSDTAEAKPVPAASDSGAAQPEEEGENVYRHTPLVKSAAKALHLSVETTARMFEFINFAIIFFAIAIPLVRIFPKLLRKRSETLRASIESARKLTEDANSRLSAVEAKLAKLDEEIAQIRAQVEEESRKDEQRIKASIEEESARIVTAAEQEIGLAAAQARRGLRNFAADLAIDQAAKQLILTPETDRALIAEFVADVARQAAAGNGKAGIGTTGIGKTKGGLN